MISVWLIALDPLINRDAIIYLRAADAYLQDGFAASQQHFGRPVLSICMAWMHQLTGIPLVYAGLAITTAFYALLNHARPGLLGPAAVLPGDVDSAAAGHLRRGQKEPWYQWLEEQSLEELLAFDSERRGRVSIVAVPRAQAVGEGVQAGVE